MKIVKACSSLVALCIVALLGAGCGEKTMDNAGTETPSGAKGATTSAGTMSSGQAAQMQESQRADAATRSANAPKSPK